MVEFGGWDMPVAYAAGILQEHLATRRSAGLFDVSHMGRFTIRGKDAVRFLQYALTNNCAGLDSGMAQYTVIPDENGCAVDDAYLYRLDDGLAEEEPNFLLVVNASNVEKDWVWLNNLKSRFDAVSLEDASQELAMIALQGPSAKCVLGSILEEGLIALPDPWRNRLRECRIEGENIPLTVSRTGYTGEPLCFELFLPGAEGGLSLGEDPRRKSRRGSSGAGRPGHFAPRGWPSPLWARTWDRQRRERHPHPRGPFDCDGCQLLLRKGRFYWTGCAAKAEGRTEEEGRAQGLSFRTNGHSEESHSSCRHDRPRNSASGV